MSIPLPTSTFFYSESTGSDRKIAAKYIAQRIGHPDEGSEFEKKLGMARYAFRIPILGKTLAQEAMQFMQTRGYDALLLRHDVFIAGITAFQRHGLDLHVFSVEIKPEYRGLGLAQTMLEDFVAKTRAKGIEKIRLGGGNNPATNGLVQKLADSLNLQQKPGNWLILS
jgi:GNAT superfamily N-acetyltransferase